MTIAVIAAVALASSLPVKVHSGIGASVVQDSPGYNSWPMILSIGDKVVCVYSRGTDHTIGEGQRGVYAKTSGDGGKTWGEEVCVVNDPSVGEVTIGKGMDNDGAMLFWIRRWGRTKGHDLYRTSEGKTFEKISSPEFSPMPMQVTDVFHVPGVGLMSLWFAGAYNNEKDGHSWGTLTSADNGRTWTQHTIEGNLSKADWPTEHSAVYLGDGRILAIARTEVRDAQFQLTSVDNGKTWRRERTNIKDVRISTPSLVFDAKNGIVYNYYYQRGAKKLKRRVAKADHIFSHPSEWPEPETLAEGNEVRPHDAGNVNATRCGGRHILAAYSGSPTNAAVFVVFAPVIDTNLCCHSAVAIRSHAEQHKPCKKMIGYGWDVLAVSIEDVWRNRNSFMGSGFDGILLPLSVRDDVGRLVSARDVMCAASWSDAKFSDSVRLSRDIVKCPGLKESLALTFFIPQTRLSWTDDAAWATACSNMTIFARAVRSAGLKGFGIDHEDYTKVRQFRHEPTDPPQMCTERLARIRGRELFRALFMEHPDAVLLFFWMYTEMRDCVLGKPDAMTATRAMGNLWPAFLDGMLDVLPPSAKIVDGNETTGYKTNGDASLFRGAAYETVRMALPLVAPEHRGLYSKRVSVGFGQYFDMYVNKVGTHWSFPPLGTKIGSFNRNLLAASEVADEYVWLYGEQGTLVKWDCRDDKRTCRPTWEELLPGVTTLIRAAKGDYAVFEAADGNGSVTNLLSNSSCTSFDGKVPAEYTTWTQIKNPPIGMFSYDGQDGASAPGCLKLSGDGSYTATADGLCPGDLVYVCGSKKGGAALIRIAWKKNGVWQWDLGTLAIYTSINSDPDRWQRFEQCAVVPEGCNGLGVVLGGNGTEVAPIRYDDVKVLKVCNQYNYPKGNKR